jgi:hypothetical protein
MKRQNDGEANSAPIQLGILGNVGRVLLVLGAALFLVNRLHRIFTGSEPGYYSPAYWRRMYITLAVFAVGAVMAFTDYARVRRKASGTTPP